MVWSIKRFPGGMVLLSTGMATTTVGARSGRVQVMAIVPYSALLQTTRAERCTVSIPSATTLRSRNPVNRGMLFATNITDSGNRGMSSATSLYHTNSWNPVSTSASSLRDNNSRNPVSISASSLQGDNSRNPVSMAQAQAESKEAVSVKEGDQQEDTGPPTVPENAWGTKEPRRFHVRSDQWIKILGSSLSLPFRFGSGALVTGYKISLVPVAEFPLDRYASFEIAGRKIVETGSPGPKPEKPIELYEFEGCPFCRKVREIVSILDLDVLYYPTPKNGPNFRPRAIQMGGKKQFPYMVDPNTGVSMYESDDIIKYLVKKYGDGKVPTALSLGPITSITASLAMLGRLGKGSTYTPSRLPEKPLQVWAYEPSPFCKIVREKLVELELPHYYYSTPRGSEKRNDLFQRVGHFQVPYLEDPNTGVKMFESADIVDYLQQTYAIPSTPQAA